MRSLAEGTTTQAALAKKYGVTPMAITQFKHRHANQIEEIRQNLEDEMAGLWIAKKFNRIAEYQEDLEDINENPERYNSPEFRRIKTNVLKAVAEELGQLPAKMTRQELAEVVRYVVNGVNPEDLQ